MTDEFTLEAKRKKAERLEAGNDRSFNELNEKLAEYHAPPQQMDVSGMRLEMLIDALKGRPEFEEAMLDFEIACHEKISKALDDQWVKLREAIKEYEKKKNGLAVVKKPDTLLDQHGRPLKST